MHIPDYILSIRDGNYEEALKGSLAVGKLADLVILQRDIFTMPPMEIPEACVQATMVGGQWVYRRHGFDTGE